MSHVLIARGARAALRCWLLTAMVAVAACSSGNNNRNVNSSVATSTGDTTTGTVVSLTSSTGSVALNAGDSITLTATVTNDKNSAGVTWTLSGTGTLSGNTNGSVVYTAPASLAGSSTPTITATSIADTTQAAAATLYISGSPVIDNQVVLFPANVGSAYAAAVNVIGGVAPFTWAVTSGALPDGITLTASTTASEAFSGTPTSEGSYPFQMTVTDSNSRTASVNLTLVVNSATSCLLNGHFALLTSGIGGGLVHVRAASFSVDSTGNLTGVVDRKQSGSTTVGESWSGTCTNRAGNSGTLVFKGATDSPTFNYSVSASLATARLQLTNGGDSTTSTGQLYKQTPADFSLARLAGSFAFGLLGSDSSNNRLGYAGQLTVAANGTVTAGRMDSNAGSGALTGATLSGTLGAPDANGRGTMTLAGGGQTLSLAYYVVTADRLLLTVSDNSGTSPRVAGTMTRRAASFGAGSLVGASVLTLWGASGVSQPVSVLSVGRISAAAGGTFSLLLDTADHAKIATAVAATATSYAVESDGRVSLNFTSGTTARQLTGYLDGTSNGYVVERGSSSGNAGLLEVQMAGPFTDTLPGLFVFGSQFPQSSSPVTLLPVVYLSGGNLSAANGSGYVAIDAGSGRGPGSFSVTALGGAGTLLYIVNADKMVALRVGSSSQNGALEWLVK